MVNQNNNIEIVSKLDGSIETLKANRIHYLHEDLYNDVAMQKGWELIDTPEPESIPRGDPKARSDARMRHHEIRTKSFFQIINVFFENDIDEIRSFSVDGIPLVINSGNRNNYL